MVKPTDQDGLHIKRQIKSIFSDIIDVQPHDNIAILTSFERQMKHTENGDRNTVIVVVTFMYPVSYTNSGISIYPT